MRSRVGLLILFPALAGCPLVKDAAPAVQLVEVPVRQYVNVPPELLKRCDWPKKAKLADVIEVARKRRACLEQYEGQFDGIGKLSGEGRH